MKKTQTGLNVGQVNKNLKRMMIQISASLSKNYSDMFPTFPTRDLCFEGGSVGRHERNIFQIVAYRLTDFIMSNIVDSINTDT